MDIDKICEDIAAEVTAAGAGDLQYKILNAPLEELKIVLGACDLKNEDIRAAIFERYQADCNILIDEFISTSDDPQASNGMYKCSLETWKTCAATIGRNYFLKYKLVRDYKRERAEGGLRLNNDLMDVGLALYEYYCNKFRKQFFIYDSAKFLGLSLDSMYTLSELHARYLKKAHSIQEDSMRTALASGRSNVTAMAILLNHDYDYTRTTQVIHTDSRQNLTADKLPQLSQVQDIVLTDNPALTLNDIDGL